MLTANPLGTVRRALPWGVLWFALTMSLAVAEGPSPAEPAPFAGRPWQLDAYLTDAGMKPAADGDGERLAIFDGGRFRINAGCGALTGGYWHAGTRLLFSPQVESTLRDCPNTLLVQEEAVLNLLRQVEGFAPKGWQLALLNADGGTLILLAPPTATQLQGQAWRLTTYRNAADVIVPALPEPTFTLRFDSPTDLSGQACDAYRAAYRQAQDALQLLGPIAAGRFGCVGRPDASAQGAEYLAVLRQVAGYRVEATSLLLRDANGRMVARFSALPPANGLAGAAVPNALPPAPVPRLP